MTDNNHRDKPIPWVQWDALATIKRREDDLRMLDKFALQAMSMLAVPKEYMGGRETNEAYKNFTSRAYRIADAMMAEDDRRWEEKWKDVTFI